MIMVNESDFEGRLDLEEFSDLVDRVNKFSECKDMPEDNELKFVSPKLKGHTLVGGTSPM